MIKKEKLCKIYQNPKYIASPTNCRVKNELTIAEELLSVVVVVIVVVVVVAWHFVCSPPGHLLSS